MGFHVIFIINSYKHNKQKTATMFLRHLFLTLFAIVSPTISFMPSRLRKFRVNELVLSAKLIDHFDALLFDCDGVIAETERDCHRITFNQAFKWKGLTNEWGVEKYGQLLKIGGGKERMTAYFNEVGWPASVVDKGAFVQDLHVYKTAQFKSLVESGVLPLRPGGKYTLYTQQCTLSFVSVLSIFP